MSPLPTTTEIDARFGEIAATLDGHVADLAQRTPPPLDALVRRLGAVQVEALRQYGHLSVVTIDAVNALAQSAWSGVTTVSGTAGDMAESTLRTVRDTGERVLADVDDVLETTGRRARGAAGAIRKNLSVVGDAAERTAGRVASRAEQVGDDVVIAADDAVEKAFEAGTSRPSGPYETWTKDELYERAQELDIDGRSGMTKTQLVKALRSA